MMNFISLVDTSVINAISPIRNSFLTGFFKFVTFWGEGGVIVAIATILTFILIKRLKIMPIIILWIITFGTAANAYLLKILVGRTRPLGGLVDGSSFSFPSAHTSVSIAFYGFIIYLTCIYIKKEWLRNFIIIGGVIDISLISFSRLYLGVHYLSDVLAGVAVGGVWLTISIYLLKLTSLRTNK